MGSVSGFAPATSIRSRVSLFAATPTAAIEEALEATKKFGATSAEAKVAWDTVEDMSQDNSAATAGTMDENCSVEDEISKKCQEYGEKLDELASLVKEQEPYLEKMKSLAS